MKKTLLSMVAAAAMISTSAMAQTVPAGVYIGVGGDYVMPTEKHADKAGQAGVNVGYNLNKLVSLEVGFRNAWAHGNQKEHQSVMLDVMVGAPVNLGVAEVKPYALIGTGYGFASRTPVSSTVTTPVYNLGGGLVYAVSKSVDLDLRYTHTDAYNTSRHSSNELGMNVNYKF